MVSVLLALFLLVAPWNGARAQGAVAPPLHDYVADRWTSREGLPHNSIRDIAQTPDGYLWFATWEGLVRYDGLEFTVYSRATEDPALPDNGVGSLYVDPSGALWMSDSRGNIGRHGPDGSWRFWHSDGSWPRVLVHAMTMDREGRLWLLFEGHGLGTLYPDGRLEYSPPPDGVPLPASFPRMAIGEAGRLWIGGMDGLMVREPGGEVRRAPAALGASDGLAWPYRAPDGAVWVVRRDALLRLQDGRVDRTERVAGLGTLTALLQDRRGDLWVGSESRGLLRIGAHGVESPDNGMARPPGRIVSLLEDAEGSIWAGANGGLFRIRETLFTRMTQRCGLSGDYVRAVFEDGDGNLWVGSAGGLDRVRPDGRIEPVVLQPGVPPSVLSITQSGNGDLWVGAYGGIVFQLRDGRVLRRHGAGEGMPPGHVRALAADPAGGVWAATGHGPVRIHHGRVERPDADGLTSSLVTALEMVDGALWIGSVEGASVLEDGRGRRLPLERLADARTVFGFQQVGRDVWISTDRGLYRHRDGALARVGVEQGMPVDTVFQIVPDRLGNAWITSNRGMLRASLADLHAVADGTLARLPLERYDEADGMSSSQGNGSSSPSAILRADGTVWMATASGISAVDPLRWQGFRRRSPPPPVIDAVRVDGSAYPWRVGDRLPPGARISVDYLGLGFVGSDRIRYRTWLEGLDRDWVEHGRQRSVNYVGLPPGRYRLRVAAAYPDGGWSAREARWEFSVEPHWWQRPGMQVLGMLAGLLLVGLLFRWQLARYRTANDRLARLVDERTRALSTQAARLLAADQEKSDLLERLRTQAEAFERQAYEDALTGLPNRRSFDEALQREFAFARRLDTSLTVLALDIDHFKSINDTHTHAAGDAVLRGFGALLAEVTRASDLAARTGGEEFTVLLPGAAAGDASALYRRIQERLAEGTRWGGVEGLRVTVSAGATSLQPTDTSPAQLIRRADGALYSAKHAGRNRLHLA